MRRTNLAAEDHIIWVSPDSVLANMMIYGRVGLILGECIALGYEQDR